MLGHFLIFNSFLQNLAAYQKRVEGQRATGRGYLIGMLQLEKLQQEVHQVHHPYELSQPMTDSYIT